MEMQLEECTCRLKRRCEENKEQKKHDETDMWGDKKVLIPNRSLIPTYALFTQRRIMAHAHYLVHLDKLRKWIEIRPKLDANSKRIKYSPKKRKSALTRTAVCSRKLRGEKINCRRCFVFDQKSFFIGDWIVFDVSDINTDTHSASAGSSPPCGAREEPPAVYCGVSPYPTSAHILHPPKDPFYSWPWCAPDLK